MTKHIVVTLKFPIERADQIGGETETAVAYTTALSKALKTKGIRAEIDCTIVETPENGQAAMSLCSACAGPLGKAYLSNRETKALYCSLPCLQKSVA